jgi:hypothetical protein
VVDDLADEERYTFSSLMTSLIEVEGKLGQLYEAIKKETDDPNLKALLTGYERNSLRGIESMRRARIESVVEIMLEPITNLKLAEPIARINASIAGRTASNLEKAIAVGKLVCELYAMASPKVMNTSADAGELLLTLSRESIERVHELEQYASS